jgi:putative SOS response-associated peptidase YedK
MKFYENVHLGNQNIVLQFAPREGGMIVVPALFDQWQEGKTTLDSFAVITSDPNPEVKAAGHDRTPIALPESNVGTWLHPELKDKKEWVEFLNEKRKFYFENQEVA